VFKKILIANRGEIAVRVIRACRELEIAPIAIYSEADSEALHVRLADSAYPCGAAPARESYLVAERVVEIAQRAGADAIHPGYGFLSENAEFADRCEAAGIRFIGPKGDVIRAMGDKITARQKMASAGVAVVPGVSEPIADAEAAQCAESIGYPVLVKASAGGGGKGMRRVDAPEDLSQALERVRGEASSAFGDATLYLEKFVENPRHIEIQFLADSHGNAVHLGERECSIQRRHQKLIEEAPANRVSPELRAELGRAAVTAAKAVDYCGAGTCEFLVDGAGNFYFLEMNTRIQVEHAITEAVTGIDLVVAMIRIAAGEPLAFAQSDVEFRGHAIEARIYAENPDRNFIPSPGLITTYRPPSGPGVRIDAGVDEGTKVTVHYDPMIAKLIAWGADRKEAIARLDGALAEFDIQGIKTSIPFHREALLHPDFVSGSYTTEFVESLIKEKKAKKSS
jgi:acetyl-CoA carboxylase biotin carboxylase subunit